MKLVTIIHQPKRRTGMKTFIKFIQEEKGTSAVEYGLLVSLIAVAIVAAISALGSGISSTFSTAASSLG